MTNEQKALQIAQEIVRKHVPTARCELQDYGHQIGCGDLDAWGNIQDVKLRRSHWNEDSFNHAGEVLKRKLATGGSTAG
ncbi:hypothetical protein [Sphingomonas sp. Leaf4]|uniref:hypothetical protein n=1 Tax=Sphingomonas sp. Leaf4 TaxID=2876553 RepID=UPI001E51E4B3|nr:hypothetical protein [Sphingomonas sp. Leaf4]